MSPNEQPRTLDDIARSPRFGDTVIRDARYEVIDVDPPIMSVRIDGRPVVIEVEDFRNRINVL